MVTNACIGWPAYCLASCVTVMREKHCIMGNIKPGNLYSQSSIPEKCQISVGRKTSPVSPVIFEHVSGST